MAVFKDYLDWRGDVPFSVSPVNDADSYLFAVLNTLNWSGIVPTDGGCIPLYDAVEKYFSLGAEELGISGSKDILRIIRRLPSAKRYEPVLLTGWQKICTAEEQFGALTLRLPDGRHYISYQGTDDTLSGWREDCMLAVEDAVPAQKSAAAYLTRYADTHPGELVIGGHSKGGNLALFAAASVRPGIQQRITAVYDFDGPGFEKSFFASDGFRRIAPKVHSILSENAIVGMLFYMEAPTTVVKTGVSGIQAHDGLNWEICARGFVPAEGLSPLSRLIHEAVDNALRDLDRAERKEFITDLFDTLTATGAVTLTDLTEQSLRQTLSTSLALNGKEGVRRLIREVLENMARCYVNEKAAAIPRPELPKLKRVTGTVRLTQRLYKNNKPDPKESPAAAESDEPFMPERRTQGQ